LFADEEDAEPFVIKPVEPIDAPAAPAEHYEPAPPVPAPPALPRRSPRLIESSPVSEFEPDPLVPPEDERPPPQLKPEFRPTERKPRWREKTPSDAPPPTRTNSVPPAERQPDPSHDWDPLAPTGSASRPPILKRSLRALSCEPKPKHVLINEDLNQPCPADRDYEDVKLDPRIYRDARHVLNFTPSADMFASRAHRQTERYYSADRRDKQAEGNAFHFDWKIEQYPYINPPWSLMD
jgi:hypothetical protein